MKQMMQAVRVYQHGGVDQLRLEGVPIPEPEPDEVLVRVHAAGILPVDWKIRRGDFKNQFATQFPYIPGSSFAGVIEATGSNVDTFHKGETVFGRTGNGAYAEYTTAGLETIALKPQRISFIEAATISGGATTAWNALFEVGALKANQQILIHGAAGGVGAYAVQFARWKGASVAATASTHNIDFVHALGAETVIDYTDKPFEHVIKDVDMVLDIVGGEVLQRSMTVVKRGGTVVSLVEEPSQVEAQAREIRALKNTAHPPFPSTQLLETIAGLIDRGDIKAVVGQVFSFHDVQQAHERSQTGHGQGRIVLSVTAENQG